MPRLEEVHFYLKGLYLLARHNPQGFHYLDFTDRGMMRSFWAIVWCLPAILVSWLWRRAIIMDGMPESFRLGTMFYARLTMVEAAGWIFPVVLVGLMLFALNAAKYFPAVVAINNWLSVPFSYASMVLVLIIAILPGAAALVSWLWLALALTLITALYRILFLVCGRQVLLASTLTMLLFIPPMLLSEWLMRFLGLFPL